MVARIRSPRLIFFFPDFDKDLIHLEAASKIQLKLLAEEMQAINKGLEIIEQYLLASIRLLDYAAVAMSDRHANGHRSVTPSAP
ncbi:formin-like protein 3 [Lolium rigidum]|uniref:formin-like protein 3 n=1 Tax=Lolium rigidum TaxID=89674 RepID=UPI001F5C900F|nr:formin-like protein 3 [Lolium rigidum]